MTLLRRTKTIKVWLIDQATIHRAYYESAAFPAVGETIFVRRATIDDGGSWRSMSTKPVPARVTRVRGGIITASTYDEA